MLNIQPINDAPEDRLKVLIHGKQGSGKSTLATSFAEIGPILYMDFPGELGADSLRRLSYAHNIHRVEILRPKDLNEVFNLIASGNHEYSAIVVDSVSAAQIQFQRQIQQKSPGQMQDFGEEVSPFDYQKWGQMLERMSELVVFFYSLASAERPKPVHVIMTSQTKVSVDDLTQEESIVPAIRGASLSLLLGAADYIMYTFVQEEVDDNLTNSRMAYRVRLGSHPTIATKIRRSVEEKPLPDIVGAKGRLTLPKFAKILGKSV